MKGPSLCQKMTQLWARWFEMAKDVQPAGENVEQKRKREMHQLEM